MYGAKKRPKLDWSRARPTGRRLTRVVIERPRAIVTTDRSNAWPAAKFARMRAETLNPLSWQAARTASRGRR